jgi:methylmalonyl-CoA/ethylmalonyl-CoA epimerase
MNSNNEQDEQSKTTGTSQDALTFHRIDHIAIAVRDLDRAITFYSQILGFKFVRRLEITGQASGMLSAEMEYNKIKFVLCQGTNPQSQVSQLIQNYGPGVAHIAFEVDDVPATVTHLKNNGLSFDTSVIGGPGLQQAFSSRDSNSGMAFEFIRRNNEDGFVESNIQELFDQLEKSGSY